MSCRGSDPTEQSRKRAANLVNYRDQVALQQVNKFWDRCKEEAEHNYNREQREIKQHLYELNQRRFIIRVHHAVDSAVRRFSQSYKYQGGDLLREPDAWKKTLMDAADWEGIDRESLQQPATFHLVKIAEDKYWHQSDSRKRRPSTITKFPRLAQRRLTCPDTRRSSFVYDPTVHRTALDTKGPRRGSDPHGGQQGQPTAQFKPRPGPSHRLSPSRMGHTFGGHAPHPLPVCRSKTAHDTVPVPLASTTDHDNLSAHGHGHAHASQHAIDHPPPGLGRRATIVGPALPMSRRGSLFTEHDIQLERESSEMFNNDNSKTETHVPIAISSVMRQIARVNMPPPFDPVGTLNCRYLRLSENNVKELTEMCESQGIKIGIHGHMTQEQVIEYFESMQKMSQLQGAANLDGAVDGKSEESRSEFGAPAVHKSKTRHKHE
ncbi:hypothetical protein LSAT2_021479 [Lamellibrachia satsuma]|nr:hypothetical protein LSAT2_021479 [Lamellibrachia satsuma]